MDSEKPEKPAGSSTSSDRDPSNATTLMYSKTRTVFGSTDDSVYLIKEHKYEVTKVPYSMQRDYFEKEKKSKEKNSKKKGSSSSQSPSAFEEESIPTLNADKTEEEIVEEILKDIKESKATIFEEGGHERELPKSEQEKKHGAKSKRVTEVNDKDKDKDENETDSEEAKGGVIQQMCQSLNRVFQYRADDIEEKTPDDWVLKIKTYQEWVESLLKSNRAIIKTMANMKKEIFESCEVLSVEADTRTRHSHDRDVLIKIIREAFHTGVWNMDSLNVETHSLAEFLRKDLVRAGGGDGSSGSSQSEPSCSRTNQDSESSPDSVSS